jgi:8-oxo-dGTP diphosphatase
MEYVAGFAVYEGRVALVRKLKPAWQAGKLNAIGGKIEAGESPIQAMVREFAEETGVISCNGDWQNFVVLHGPWGVVHFFVSYTIDVSMCRTMEAETIEVVATVDDGPYLPYGDTYIRNLKWLVPLAHAFKDTQEAYIIHEVVA